MANVGWVKTRKKIRPEQVNHILSRLNCVLFNQLVTPFYEEKFQSWNLVIATADGMCDVLSCHLETSRHFRMKHTNGSIFTQWVDTVILNEIAVAFSGSIGDDNDKKKCFGERSKYDHFPKYFFEHVGSDSLLLKWHMDLVPKIFHKDIKIYGKIA